jgi:hypothetical protein
VKAGRNQVFLERRSYRQRRLGDAARLLPVLGLFLCLLPLFWAPETAGAPRATAWDGVYLFVVWVVLIVLAAILARRLRPLATSADEHEGTGAHVIGKAGAGE